MVGIKDTFQSHYLQQEGLRLLEKQDKTNQLYQPIINQLLSTNLTGLNDRFHYKFV